MKNLKKLFLSLTLITALTSCKSDDPKNDDTTNPDGNADITLTAGTSEFKIIGPCGWASAGGTKYIGARHSLNSTRIFSAFFDIDKPPTTTTSYILTDRNLEENPKYITLNISEIVGNKLTEWSSTKTSGTLTLTVDGNKITANLSGITLAPKTDHSPFENGNIGDFAKEGKLTGTLTFYK